VPEIRPANDEDCPDCGWSPAECHCTDDLKQRDFPMRNWLLIIGTVLALAGCVQTSSRAPPADMGPWSPFHPSEVAIGGG
jgi:hypothetical protein